MPDASVPPRLITVVRARSSWSPTFKLSWNRNFPVLFGGAATWVLLWTGLSALCRVWPSKPIFAPTISDACFVERWTSGQSNRNLITKLHRARNCLFVAVTSDSLIVQKHFPFNLVSLVPGVDNLEFVIPREAITTVAPRRGLLGQSIEIVFTASNDRPRSIQLWLRDPETFLQIVRA